MQVNELPLYPNETLLWDENLVPLGQYYGGKVMALPKLNLQFLTSHDYLLRRVESTYVAPKRQERAYKPLCSPAAFHPINTAIAQRLKPRSRQMYPQKGCICCKKLPSVLALV